MGFKTLYKTNLMTREVFVISMALDRNTTNGCEGKKRPKGNSTKQWLDLTLTQRRLSEPKYSRFLRMQTFLGGNRKEHALFHGTKMLRKSTLLT